MGRAVKRSAILRERWAPTGALKGDAMQSERCDFAATEERARKMTSRALWWALGDIRKTLPFADAMDRADGGDRGGRYRDEASVYRAELVRRAAS